MATATRAFPRVLAALGIGLGACVRNGTQPAATVGERAAERERMVAQQIEARGVSDERVLAAMRAVPRHLFVPAELRARAYEDGPLPIGLGQTISQPYIVAVMTEVLALGPESRVLEIGSGSGYQAAVLAEITPHVFTIEIVPALGERAARTLVELGYGAVRCRIGDGYFGWPEEAPFDAIVVTAAPGFVPPKLVEQLAEKGRMCLPVGAGPWDQELLLITKEAGRPVERNLGGVRFVPMTGAAQQPGARR